VPARHAQVGKLGFRRNTHYSGTVGARAAITPTTSVPCGAVGRRQVARAHDAVQIMVAGVDA
jgi:hypothetical protein